MNQEDRIAAAQERLTALIPLFYRTLDAAAAAPDAEDRGPLLQLVEVMARQAGLVDEDIARLYDGWFIETCDDWVVPYIGDLVGAPQLPGALADGQRRFVANTLAYRRRKGTARVVEQLASDVTGWSAIAVEAFRGLALTQSMKLLRPHQGGTADLRNPTVAGATGGPFDAFSHVIDTRRPEDAGARWGIPALDLFLWRLEPWLLPAVQAAPDPAMPWLFHAHPDRLDRPWSNRARADSSVDQLSREADLPTVLRRRPIADELRARRLALADGTALPNDWFPASATTDESNSQPVFRIMVQQAVGDPWQEIAPEQLRVCNLSEIAAQPDPAIPVRDGGGTATLLVDPVNGRIAVPTGAVVPHIIRVDHWLGYAAEIGAGPFDRNAAIIANLSRWISEEHPLDWQGSVAAERTSIPADNLFGSVEEAIAAWEALPAQPRVGLLLIEDSAIHRLPAGGLNITLRSGETLMVAAGRWPFDGAKPLAQRFSHFDASAVRPHLEGDIVVKAEGGGSANLLLDGLSHAGSMTVEDGRLGSLTITNCTLGRAQPLRVKSNPELAIRLLRSMTGALRIADIVPALTIGRSIIHGSSGAPTIRAAGALLEIEDSSVFGTVARVRELHASNTLFTGAVIVDRVQSGCVRFSYLPTGSRTPRPYRCQPAPDVTDASLVPQTVSLDRASPWYAQLHPLSHPAIRKGGDDGGEIGAFRSPSSSLLEANIRTAIGQSLRVGLQAGLFLTT